jgi:hypothetical protein
MFQNPSRLIGLTNWGLVLILLVVVGTACAGGAEIGGGNVIPPEQGTAVVRISVLAADDLGTIDAKVLADGVELPTDQDGLWWVEWTGAPIEVAASAPGFQSFNHEIEKMPERGRVEFRLEPVVLTGRITTDDGRPLPGAVVELADISDQSDNEGRYTLERAVPGTMHISRPAWQNKEFQWDGGIDELDIPMVQLEINAIRASAEDIADATRWNKILEVADSTAINGLVVDLKLEDGTVAYPSQVADAVASGAINSFFDPAMVLAEAEERGLYTIGRIVTFQDDFFTAANPDQAVTTSTGELWRASNGFAWLDPSDPAAYEYAVAIADEACSLGFDEIQFDYVSWPIGDLSDAQFDGEYNQEVRVASITSFLDRAYTVLHPRCAVSATVLGIVLESGSDEGVGQQPSSMSRVIDVLSPTLYSTNYGAGWKNMDDPNEQAVEVVTTALDGGITKLDGFAYLRPWLQTWAISDADQRAVQSAVTDDGMGWLLWSNNTNYSRANLPAR